MKKNEEKLEVLNTCIALQSLTARAVVFCEPSTLSWKTGREQDEAPTIQGEMVRKILHHLDRNQGGCMESIQRY